MLDEYAKYIGWAIPAFLLLFLMVIAFFFSRFYRKVDQGRALIVNTMRKEPVVTFTGKIVIPILHRAEVMDISIRTIDIDRRGKEGLICADNIRADIKVAFFVRVNKTSEDVLKVAQAIGCARASDPDTLEELFVAKFSEALKTVGKRLEFEQLYTMRDDFRDQIIQVIGKDLNGYVLDDAAIDFLEQTPIESLDPSNILDAQGIRKITEMTAAANVKTNMLKQEEKKAIRKQDVEAAEALFELDRQEADAKAKQEREIANIRAREQAETLKVQAEEKRKSELARIKQEEEVSVQEENKQRQVEIAQKARERAIAVETERVEKDRALEAISREREVELQRIDKEKALEVERKAIADVIAARIAVEKTVAEEEERIKDLRLVAEAKRQKEAKIVGAEAAAQEALVLSIKEAEAKEQVARHHAKEKLTLAEAELEASDRIAQAKIRVAEGTQAEAAAEGLAKVRVKEADALAVEKLGMAEAKVKLETLQAEARGEEEKGMVQVRVKQADAQAVQQQGKAQADAKRDMLAAEASGIEQQGLAVARSKEAEAVAIEKQGQAEAVAIREKMSAEAAGLLEKANSMRALEGETREHEEFRLRLEKQTQVELEQLAVRQAIAKNQADVMGSALGNAKINLVGGDGKFLDQFFRAVALGHSADGVVEQSDTVRQLVSDYLDGKASLREDVTRILTEGGVSSETVKNLSVAAVLRRLSVGLDPMQREKLDALIGQAKELGLP